MIGFCSQPTVESSVPTPSPRGAKTELGACRVQGSLELPGGAGSPRLRPLRPQVPNPTAIPEGPSCPFPFSPAPPCHTPGEGPSPSDPRVLCTRDLLAPGSPILGPRCSCCSQQEARNQPQLRTCPAPARAAQLGKGGGGLGLRGRLATPGRAPHPGDVTAPSHTRVLYCVQLWSGKSAQAQGTGVGAEGRAQHNSPGNMGSTATMDAGGLVSPAMSS